MADRWLAYQAGLGFFRQEPLFHPSEVRFLLYHRSHTDHFGTSSGHPACDELRQLHPLLRGMPRKSAFPRTVNPWRCKSYLTQKKEVLNEEEKNILRKTPLIFGCDECQKCCPLNENAAYSPPSGNGCRPDPLSGKRNTGTDFKPPIYKRIWRICFSPWRGRPVLLRNMDIIEKNKSPSSL